MGIKADPPSSGQVYCLFCLLALTWSFVMLARFTLGRRGRVFLGAAALTLALSLVFVLFTVACGGGNAGGGASNPGTASGTYTLTLNGSVSLGSSSLMRNLSLTLHVN